ncbi:MAG: transglutaminase family protein [Aestuariivita sp.]|nr:transglutaminase family protein [Aestuariivita sp.]MCY4203460.1 transglutaminase family protein [Aestuariivita sp.]MCY4288501.1 transglutaminase family protein [Aestuariivita sp.]MCY4347085.1 transglutaminase family protein [Aestuariivita sp.]
MNNAKTLRIRHRTHYAFEVPITYGLQQVRMLPREDQGQRVISWKVEIDGGVKELEFIDHHSNNVQLFSFHNNVLDVLVVCEGMIEIGDQSGVVGKHRALTPLWLFERETSETRAGSAVRGLAQKVKGGSDLKKLHALSELIKTSIIYQTEDQYSGRSADRIVQDGFGVCQDHAHVFIAAARHMGFPCRYVSGYLLLDDTDEQEAMHAWVEAHIFNLGWVGFDVSNGISPDNRYVKVATGLSYQEAAPIIGTRIGGGSERLNVAIEVAQQ